MQFKILEGLYLSGSKYYSLRFKVLCWVQVKRVSGSLGGNGESAWRHCCVDHGGLVQNKHVCTFDLGRNRQNSTHLKYEMVFAFC